MDYPGAIPPPRNIQADINDLADVLRTYNYVTQALTMFFVTISVATRYYARSKVLRLGFTWDDYAVYSCYVFMVGYCITSCFASKYGGGLNMWDVSKKDIPSFFQTGYAVTIFYAPMALTVKLALLFMIMQVFGSVHRKTSIGIKVFIGMIVGYYISGFFVKIFICWPISAYWHGEADKCMNQSAIITADAIISVVSDLAILLLPTPLAWSLQLPMRKRLRVIGILCAGGVATAFSVYRLAMIVNEGKSPNQTIVFIKVILSGNAEVGLGLICACLPSVNALCVCHKKGASYYAQYDNNSNNKSATNGSVRLGEIIVTRSYHIDSSKDKETRNKSELFEMSYDQAKLVSIAHSPTRTNSRSSSGDFEQTARWAV